MHKMAWLIALMMLAVVPACGGGDGSGEGDSDSDGDTDGDSDGDSDGDTDGDSDGDTDGDSDGDSDSDADADRPVDCSDYSGYGDVDAPGFDPSVDPGVHPVFLCDPFFTQEDEYEYVKTSPGDHDLDDGIVAVSYDVTGGASLREVLIPYHEDLGNGHGLALYLDNGNELNDEDMTFLQSLNQDHTGWSGLGNLDTLHVYNLFTVPAGIRSTDPAHVAYGIPTDLQLFFNGWQSEGSEIMEGNSWVRHIVMDDLTEIPAGAFCDTDFLSMSFRGARIVRELGLGFAPRADASELFLPSVEILEQHALKRRQQINKYYFPKLVEVGDFAIDDNTNMHYLSAPSLVMTGERNSFNDPRYLIAFHLPKVEYLSLSCLGGLNETTTVFRFPELLNPHGSSLRGHENVQFFWAPKATRLGPNTFYGNASLKAVYAPMVEWVGRDAFYECVSLTSLDLPAATYVQATGFQRADSLEEVRLPVAEYLGDNAFIDLANLRRVYFGDTPPDQGVDVFAGTSADLVIYYTGDDPDWDDWRPAGNDSAQVVQQ